MLSRIERIKLDIKNYRDKLPVCDECGESLGYNLKDNGHEPLCSSFKYNESVLYSVPEVEIIKDVPTKPEPLTGQETVEELEQWFRSMTRYKMYRTLITNKN